MKKILYFLIFSLIIFAGFYYFWGLAFSDGDPGYVLIGVGHWSLESSLAVFTIILWICFFSFYVLFRFLGWLSRIPGKVKAKGKSVNVNRSQDALISGLIDTAEGNFDRAEKTLIKHAATSSAPLVHYLAAARAAQAHGAIENRDKYLKLAADKSPGSELAIDLTHAELCLSEQQHDQALKILIRLQTIHPKHASVLKLLHQTYLHLGDLDAMQEIKSSMEDSKVLKETELSGGDAETYIELLSLAAKKGSIEEVVGIWETIPENMQQMQTVESQFYEAMILVGAGARVEQDIILSLTKQWNQSLLVLFGSIQSEDPEQQIQVAEQWAELNPRDPVLMRVVGRLQIKAGNVARADTCLSKSISLEPSVEAYQLLGELMYAQGNQERAAEAFKHGLELVAADVISSVEQADLIDMSAIELPPVVESLAVAESEDKAETENKGIVDEEPVDSIEVGVISTESTVTDGGKDGDFTPMAVTPVDHAEYSPVLETQDATDAEPEQSLEPVVESEPIDTPENGTADAPEASTNIANEETARTPQQEAVLEPETALEQESSQTEVEKAETDPVVAPVIDDATITPEIPAEAAVPVASVPKQQESLLKESTASVDPMVEAMSAAVPVAEPIAVDVADKPSDANIVDADVAAEPTTEQQEAQVPSATTEPVPEKKKRFRNFFKKKSEKF